MDPDDFADAQKFLLAQTASLRAYLHMLSGNLHDAEDVLQETFTKYLRSGPAPSTEAKRWLFAVCRNEAMTLRRTHLRRTNRERAYTSLQTAFAPDPAAEASDRESVARVSDCMRKLPDDLREMVYLKFAEELSLTEISDRTGVPRSTVDLWARQGLVLLNRCFHGGGHE